MSTSPHITAAESHKISFMNLIVKPISQKRIGLVRTVIIWHLITKFFIFYGFER